MEVTETSADGLKREFRIVVPADQLEGEINRRLDELGRAIRVPGFRPGKVPMPLLRRRYGTAVRGEVLESSVQTSSTEAMEQHKLRPALPPRVEIVSAAEGGDLEYKMSVELLPDLPTLDFAALGLERLVAEIPEEEVDRAIARIAEQNRKSEPVERPAETGDIVVLDMVGRSEDREIPGTRGEGRQIEVGTPAIVPGFSERLVGVVAGEERKIELTFPADYGNPDLAGKDAVFEVTIKEVRQRLPAATDDELAKEVGLETLAELRQEVQQRMQREYDAVARQRLKRDLLDKLAERYNFPVPPGMIDIEYQNILRQYEAEKALHENEAAAETPAGAAGETPETEAPAASEAPAEPAAAAAASEPGEGATPVVDLDEKTQAEFRQIAERRVRLGLLLAEVGRANNITVTQEELNQALVREAYRHPGYERQVIDYYRKNPEALGNLRAPIYEEKVVDFVIELAKIDERKVPAPELMRSLAPEAEPSAPA